MEYRFYVYSTNILIVFEKKYKRHFVRLIVGKITNHQEYIIDLVMGINEIIYAIDSFETKNVDVDFLCKQIKNNINFKNSINSNKLETKYIYDFLHCFQKEHVNIKHIEASYCGL